MSQHKTSDRAVAFIQTLIFVVMVLVVFDIVLLTYQFGEIGMKTQINTIVKNDQLSLGRTVRYINEIYDYQFKYPANWDLSTRESLSQVFIKDNLGNLLQISIPAAGMECSPENVLYEREGIKYVIRDNLRALFFSRPLGGSMVFQCNESALVNGYTCDDLFNFFGSNFHFSR